VSECDGEVSPKRRPLPIRSCRAMRENKFALIVESKHMGQMINRSFFLLIFLLQDFLPNLDKADMGKFNFGSHTTIITSTVH
jgi:hypothetical protein